jgi:hypothetical protein
MFETNSEPATDQGETIQVPQTQWIAAAETWQTWHLVVGGSGPMLISDGPFGPCGS